MSIEYRFSDRLEPLRHFINNAAIGDAVVSFLIGRGHHCLIRKVSGSSRGETVPGKESLFPSKTAVPLLNWLERSRFTPERSSEAHRRNFAEQGKRRSGPICP